MCGAETWKLRKVDHKHLESFERGAGEDQLDRSCEK